MSPLRVIFFGTSSFAVPALEQLAADPRFSLIAVVTQPDRPVGRHATLTPPPIKLAAQKLNLPVLQFEHVKQDDAWQTMQQLTADIGVVASFGQIIPQRLLDLPRLGMINIHASVLPFYRGASPIAAAIKNGDAKTGVSIMKMDALLDHGPILRIAEEPILSTDTTTSLETRLAVLGAQTLPDTLIAYTEGQLVPQEQEHANATTVKLLSREDGLLDWRKPAEVLERLIRAYDPWPGTYTLSQGRRLKILTAQIGSQTDLSPGTTFISHNLPTVACGEQTSLVLTRVQPEGKSPMTGADFLKGHTDWSERSLMAN